MAVTLEAPEEHELLAGEDVRDAHRVHLTDVDRAAREPEVGQHRVPDLGGEQGEHPLDVLPGLHVVRVPTPGLAQAVQQHRVHVVAHAEREHPGAAGTGLGELGEPLGRLLSDRGQAVGEEEHHRQPVDGALHTERLVQRGADVRAAVRHEAVHPLPRPLQARAPGPDEVPALDAHRARECDEPEPVVAGERAQELMEGLPRLLDLLAGHRAGDVEHDRHVLRLDGADVALGRERQHEVPRLPDRPMRRDRHADRLSREGEEDRETADEIPVERDGHRLPAAVELERVRRREGVEEPVRVPHADLEARLDRLGGRHRSGRLGRMAMPPRRAPSDRSRVHELQRASGPLEDLSVPQRHLAGLTGLEGEDARPQQPLPRQLDQRRIRSAPHDLLVDRPGPLGVHDLATQLRVPLEEGEAPEDGLARQRMEVVPLRHPRPAVHEPLGDLDLRDPPLDVDEDLRPHTVDREAAAVDARLDPPLSGDRRRARTRDRERQNEAPRQLSDTHLHLRPLHPSRPL